MYGFCTIVFLNPLQDDKILDLSKLKQIADDILKGIQSEKEVQYREDNTERKGEICLKQAISPFLAMISTAKYL